MKNSRWIQYSWDAGAQCLCQLTAISSIETYPLRAGALLVRALPAVTAILISLFCQFWILHIVLTSSSTRPCKQAAAFRAPLSGRLLQAAEGRSVCEYLRSVTGCVSQPAGSAGIFSAQRNEQSNKTKKRDLRSLSCSFSMATFLED